jgi:G6PDH family F420-dependent oxidoreductase
MTRIGYTLSSEEFGPNELVEYAERAEEVGFEFLSISDHFHPWVREQGESPFVWGTLGGVAQATDEVPVGVGVAAPAFRLGPALYAQAAATAAEMFDGREFHFGVGTGEALNEHVFGHRWPSFDERMERTREAVEVIRKLWNGTNVTHRGEHFTVENATVFTKPDVPEDLPNVCASAFGEKAAQAAAEYGDGFWTVGPQGDLLDTYEDAGGPDGPKLTQMTVCYAETEEEAVSQMYKHWPQGSLSGELNQLLPTPRHFEQACEMVEEEDVRESSNPTTPDADEHIDSIQQAVDAGFDHVYVHQVGPNQEEFFEFYEEEVLPSFSV